MKKIYYFFVKSGIVLFIWMILVVTAISLHSLTLKGKVNYGDRCYQEFDDTLIKDFNREGIELNEGYLQCNTYYVNYSSTLEEKANLLFLASLSKLLSSNNLNIDLQVIIQCPNYQMMANIVDYKISYTKTIL